MIHFYGCADLPLASAFCFRSLNILAHAQIAELFIGSECGGHGHCGKDRILVRTGANHLSPITAIEKKHLTASELQAGWRLGCQCWPESDSVEVTFQIPEA